MKSWRDMDKLPPKRRQLCDFLYGGDEEDPLIWILCSVTVEEADRYFGEPLYWRTAQPLPQNVKTFSPKPEAAIAAAINEMRHDLAGERAYITHERGERAVQPSMMTIKPCPFCGSEELIVDLVESDEGDDGSRHEVFCNECATVGPPATTEEGAIHKWNNRVDPKLVELTTPRSIANTLRRIAAVIESLKLD